MTIARIVASIARIGNVIGEEKGGPGESAVNCAVGAQGGMQIKQSSARSSWSENGRKRRER